MYYSANYTFPIRLYNFTEYCRERCLADACLFEEYEAMQTYAADMIKQQKEFAEMLETATSLTEESLNFLDYYNRVVKETAEKLFKPKRK